MTCQKAAQVFGVAQDQVTKEQRDFAKRLNFGVVYGIGAQRFSMMTGLSVSEAENVLRRYFATYRGLDNYLRESANRAVNEKEARTGSGRLVRFNYDPSDRQQVSMTQRNGKNAPIQGTSADILKRASKGGSDSLIESFESIPRVLIDSLLFVENRELLDPHHPRRNPAIEWDRLARSALALGIEKIDRSGAVPGGSTLATQIEKYRHSPQGRTGSAGEKLRQMASASLRAYLDGADTLSHRRQIVVDYLDTVPLAAGA